MKWSQYGRLTLALVASLALGLSITACNPSFTLGFVYALNTQDHSGHDQCVYHRQRIGSHHAGGKFAVSVGRPVSRCRCCDQQQQMAVRRPRNRQYSGAVQHRNGWQAVSNCHREYSRHVSDCGHASIPPANIFSWWIATRRDSTALLLQISIRCKPIASPRRAASSCTPSIQRQELLALL